jgi:polyisoprenyl-teichoic acid--peptidoglycan teichoic acid transferase
MGRHSTFGRRDGVPQIAHLDPDSTSAETTRDARQRLRELRITPAMTTRRRQRMKRTMVVLAWAIALALALGAVGAWAWWSGKVQGFIRKNAGMNSAVVPILTKPKAPGKPFYMVLMGEDKRPTDKVGNSDTLMVAYVDPPRKHVTLLSIPRDTRVAIPGHGTEKINSAALLGGPALTIETVKKYTGLPISHYLVVDFNGFKDLVDAIGGVTVDVPQTIKDGKAADHNWRAEVVNKGVQRLDGAHALTFVRSRHFADGDFTRIKDQQIFLKALAKQTMQVGNVVNIPKITDALMKNVTTDMSVDDMVGLAADFKGMENGSVTGAMAPGTTRYIGGISYVIPDKVALAAMVARMEAGQPLEKTVAAGTAPAAAVKPSAVSVTVRNGAGQTGLAKEVAAYLTAAGFRVSEVSSMPRPVYDHTLVVFSADAQQAKATLVHDKLDFGTVLQTASLYQFRTNVLVIVGKDWRKQFPKVRTAQ